MNVPVNPQDALFLLVPALIALINRPAWPSWAKWLTALGVCFLAALVQVYLSGQLDPAHLHLALGKAVALVMGAYAVFWKPFKVSDLIEQNFNAGPGPGG